MKISSILNTFQTIGQQNNNTIVIVFPTYIMNKNSNIYRKVILEVTVTSRKHPGNARGNISDYEICQQYAVNYRVTRGTVRNNILRLTHMFKIEPEITNFLQKLSLQCLKLL